MATPFKLKGHALPGPKQRSPMKEPISLTTALLISAGTGLATGGVKAIAAANKKKRKTKAENELKSQKALEEQKSIMGGEVESSSIMEK